MLKLSKKFATIGLLLLLARGAEASRARLLVMGSGDPTSGLLDGSGNGGSYYYDSPYNMFYNPAWITHLGNFAIIEKSNAPGMTAQGGLIKNMDPFHVGIFMNRVWDEMTIFTNGAIFRPVELIGGMKVSNDLRIGAGITYGHYEDNNSTPTDKTDDIVDNNVKISVGAELMGLEPFAFYRLIGSEKIGSTEVTHTDYMLGVRYSLDKLRAIVGYRKHIRKLDTTPRQSFDVLGLGVSHSTEIPNINGRVYYSTGFWRVTSINKNIVPFNLSTEIDLYSWLTLRAGLRFDFANKTGGRSAGDTTTGRIGASIKKDNLAFDWAIGSMAGRGSSSSGGAETSGITDSQIFGFDGAFFAAAALRAEW